MLLDSYKSIRADRYSAKKSVREVSFLYLAPDAQSVSVIGDFNEWRPDANPMKRQPDGGWFTRIPIHHGHHKYQFCVNGSTFVLDPRAQGVARNEKNERVSIIAVS